MQQKIDVEYTDGRKASCRVTAWVEAEVERHFDLPLAECNHRTHVFYAAWVGLRQSGEETSEFDDFLKTVVDVDMSDLNGDRPDPTRKARKSTKSSP